MTQGVLPDKKRRDDAGKTALAGLPTYLDVAYVMGIGHCIRAHVHVRRSGQGWADDHARKG